MEEKYPKIKNTPDNQRIQDKEVCNREKIKTNLILEFNFKASIFIILSEKAYRSRIFSALNKAKFCSDPYWMA